MTRRHLAAPALVALALVPIPTRAHQAGLSYGTFVVEGSRVDVTIRLAAADLAGLHPGGAGDPTSAVLEAVTLTRGDSGCIPAGAAGRLDAADGVQLSRTYRCPPGGEPIHVRLGFVPETSPGHVHLAKVLMDGRSQERVVDAQHDGFDVEPRPSTWAQAARFTVLGVEHIFTGWDHVAFLFGLLLAGGALRDVVRVVSGFTVAHALTLALAALGLVSPPAAFVEPLIAASVVYVALENLLHLGRTSGTSRRRWPVAFAFGLVHGFGFAGALRELRLPSAGLVTALLSFNVGVELGQAAIVAAALPLLAALRRRPSLAPAAVPVGSLAVGAAGLVWLVQRVPW